MIILISGVRARSVGCNHLQIKLAAIPVIRGCGRKSDVSVGSLSHLREGYRRIIWERAGKTGRGVAIVAAGLLFYLLARSRTPLQRAWLADRTVCALFFLHKHTNIGISRAIRARDRRKGSRQSQPAVHKRIPGSRSREMRCSH